MLSLAPWQAVASAPAQAPGLNGAAGPGLLVAGSFAAPRAGCPTGPGRSALVQVDLQVALAGPSLAKDSTACFWLPWQTVQQAFWPSGTVRLYPGPSALGVGVPLPGQRAAVQALRALVGQDAAARVLQAPQSRATWANEAWPSSATASVLLRAGLA